MGFLEALCFAVPMLSTGWALARLQRKREPTCVGYNAACADKTFRQFTGCPAIRSRLCNDGRCSFHCKKQCECEEP